MNIFRKTIGIFELTGYYLKLLIQANFRVAYEVMLPAFKMKPAIIGVSLVIKSDFGIFLLVNLISMTPGTMSLDLSGDSKKLYVHIMYAEELDTVNEQIKKLEEKIIKITGR